MRGKEMLKKFAIVLLIGCIIFVAIDMFRVLEIRFDFMKMQSTDRISSSSSAPEIRYEPTDYVITNKEDVLKQVKEITLDLKSEQTINDIDGLFEIGNIHKIQPNFYEYEKYVVVKYKLLNIIEDLPRLYSITKAYTDDELNMYFNENSAVLENMYGITDNDNFIKLVKSLSFLNNDVVTFALIQVSTINFDYDSDCLTFNLKLDSGNNSFVYAVKVDYYKTSDNQVLPYVKFSINE